MLALSCRLIALTLPTVICAPVSTITVLLSFVTAGPVPIVDVYGFGADVSHTVVLPVVTQFARAIGDVEAKRIDAKEAFAPNFVKENCLLGDEEGERGFMGAVPKIQNLSSKNSYFLCKNL